MIAWSHSVLEGFETCQWRYYLTKVTKEVSDPPGEAMLNGRRVHKSMEDRLKHGVVLPPNLAKHEPIVHRLEELAVGGKLEAETQMALNQNYRVVPWFGKGVNSPWVRAITDVSVFKKTKAFVGDWKTGKRKEEATTQLKLSAVVLFATHPWLQEIRNSFIWLDHPNPKERFTTETFHRQQSAEIWREFLPRVARLEAAHRNNQWPKRPSGLCKAHCPVPRAKCEHSGI
jgi:hypothetical protein